MVFGFFALTAAALFAGAGFYVSFVEHPARSVLDDRSQLAQWKPAYARGAQMQASLALIGFGLGLVAWWQTRDLRRLAGAIVLVAAWPYTLLVIKPVNDALNATAPDAAGPASRAQLTRWGHFHLGRTALGVVSAALYLWASAS